jgi:hypothetical protein
MSNANPDPKSHLHPASSQPAPAPVPRRGTSNLMWLIPLMLGAGIAAFLVPEVLKNIYFAEEEAKVRNKENVVGTNTSAEPPPGVSRDPYAGMGGGSSNNAANDEKPKDDKPTDEKKDEPKEKEGDK